MIRPLIYVFSPNSLGEYGEAGKGFLWNLRTTLKWQAVIRSSETAPLAALRHSPNKLGER